MVRLVSDIPVTLTNDVLGGFLVSPTQAGNVRRDQIELVGGRYVIGPQTFSLSIEFNGSGFTDELGGQVSEIRVVLDGGARVYALSGIDLPVNDALDVFGGGGFNALVRRASGDDFFRGSASADDLRGFNGDDTLNGRGGDDVLLGDDGRDRLIGGGGDDLLDAGGGNDRAVGGGGGDLLFLGGGADVGLGGGGADQVNGGGGDDNIAGGGGADTLTGGAGQDTLRGQGGRDEMSGGGANDRLIGGGGGDVIFGGGGRDVLIGNGGADQLNGGAGDDTLNGGGGADMFIFANNSGDDLLQRFQSGRDVIDLSAVTDITDFDDLLANHAQDEGGDVVIALTPTAELRVAGVAVADLSDSDFLF